MVILAFPGVGVGQFARVADELLEPGFEVAFPGVGVEKFTRATIPRAVISIMRAKTRILLISILLSYYLLSHKSSARTKELCYHPPLFTIVLSIHNGVDFAYGKKWTT
jgi:hypothetical protein